LIMLQEQTGKFTKIASLWGSVGVRQQQGRNGGPSHSNKFAYFGVFQKAYATQFFTLRIF
jgi:hypothetical protein